MTEEQRSLTAEGITKPFSIEEVPWESWSHGARFGSRTRSLGRIGGGSHVGVVMEELAPGKQACPAHYHLLEEEHLLVLEGRMTLRLGDRSYELKAGDYVCFPAGQKAAHALVNNGEGPCRYLVIGEDNPNDVCVYPDSGKVGVRSLGTRFRQSATVDYWEGEDGTG